MTKTRFVPVVLAGLATAALTSVAAGKPWFTAALSTQDRVGIADADLKADLPLALALALVMLAAWGVVLVGRTAARRIVLSLAAAAGAGVVVAVVRAPMTLPDQIREQIGPGHGHVPVDPTGWYVAAAIASVLGLVTIVLGWVLTPRWPSMSARYDAPTTHVEPAPATETDIWKAMDQGLDPTQRDEP